MLIIITVLLFGIAVNLEAKSLAVTSEQVHNESFFLEEKIKLLDSLLEIKDCDKTSAYNEDDSSNSPVDSEVRSMECTEKIILLRNYYDVVLNPNASNFEESWNTITNYSSSDHVLLANYLANFQKPKKSVVIEQEVNNVSDETQNSDISIEDELFDTPSIFETKTNFLNSLADIYLCKEIMLNSTFDSESSETISINCTEQIELLRNYYDALLDINDDDIEKKLDILKNKYNSEDHERIVTNLIRVSKNAENEETNDISPTTTPVKLTSTIDWSELTLSTNNSSKENYIHDDNELAEKNAALKNISSDDPTKIPNIPTVIEKKEKILTTLEEIHKLIEKFVSTDNPGLLNLIDENTTIKDLILIEKVINLHREINDNHSGSEKIKKIVLMIYNSLPLCQYNSFTQTENNS